MLGKLLNKALQPVGLKLERIDDRGWYVGDFANRVSTLIDVGAAHGTPRFYALNLQAELFLIDPLREFEAPLSQILRRRRGGYEIAALGHEAGSRVINVQTDHLTKSSFLDHTDLTKLSGRVERRTVPVKTLDDIVRAHALKPPFGIKIDTEGFELDVIRGAEETLSLSTFAIIETSVQRRFKGSYDFVDVVIEMRHRGFRMANVLTAKPDRNGLVRYMDVLFGHVDRS